MWIKNTFPIGRKIGAARLDSKKFREKEGFKK